MRQCKFVIGYVLFLALPALAADFYAAPTGSASNNGSIAAPWSLAKALNPGTGVVQPGDTVYLRGGRYVGHFYSSLAGTSSAPIKVKSYPGEWAVLDGYNISVQLTSSLASSTSDRTVSVTDASRILQGNPYVIDNEHVQISSIQGNTLTINRAWNGTSVAAHAPGATIQIFSGNVLSPGGSYTWFMDLEIMSSDPVRQTAISGSDPLDILRPQGVYMGGSGNKLINLVIHDLRNGIFTPDATIDAEINGVLTYSNGWWAPDRGHGHGMYLRNGSGTLHKYTDVISFDNYATGQKVFGYDAHGEDVHFDGFTAWNNEEGNFFMGVSTYPMKNLAVRNSFIYSPMNASGRSGGKGMRFGYGTQDLDLVLENNYIAGRNGNIEVGPFQSVIITGNTTWCSVSSGSNTCSMVKLYPGAGRSMSDFTINNNTYYDNDFPNSGNTYNFHYPAGPNSLGGGTYNYNDDWKRLTPFDVNSSYTLGAPGGKPTGVRTFVRPNSREQGRAHIIVYNWDALTNVSVNLANSGLQPGDSYLVSDAQNFTGAPVASGVYANTSSSVNLPMNLTATYPAIGNLHFAPTHTSPEFGVFVVRKTGSIPPADTLPPGAPSGLVVQ